MSLAVTFAIKRTATDSWPSHRPWGSLTGSILPQTTFSRRWWKWWRKNSEAVPHSAVKNKNVITHLDFVKESVGLMVVDGTATGSPMMPTRPWPTMSVIGTAVETIGMSE